MSQEIEIEFKNALSRQEFTRLCYLFHLSKDNFTLQHNDYFETSALDLGKKGCALRIREKNKNFTLTLKQPAPCGLLETHQQLTRREKEKTTSGEGFPPGEVISQLKSLNLPINEIRHCGKLSTKRAEKAYQNGTLVFDHSFYLGKEDYELEYEASDKTDGERIFRHLLQSLGIPRNPSENKIQRFFQSKRCEIIGKNYDTQKVNNPTRDEK